MTLEYLATGAPPRRRQSWLLGLVVALVVAVLAGFLWWSESVRRSAQQSLAQAVVVAGDQSRIGEARVLSTLLYAQPMIWSSSVPEDVRAGLRSVVQGSAGDAATALGKVADGVSGTLVLPWQAAERDARDAVLGLVRAYKSRVDRIAADARAIGHVMAEPTPSDAQARAAVGASGAEASPFR